MRQETLATRKNSDADQASTPGTGGRSRSAKGSSKGVDPFESVNAEPEQLQEVTKSRYLNYALSVITSRALPDVRDGLKPVQRRILYTMWQQRLAPPAKHRKCAKVVGDVMGNYHPHGDSAIYDALVRLAQPFSLRLPLVDGSGNFGSLDGDAAAAMRYTECRLASAASPLLEELNQDTVAFRPNYDGTRNEPVVLPAQFPNLLINGATGIAVGMATNIPPHNPEEVCQAAIRLLDARVTDRELSSRELCRTIKGPDFPTGGQLVSSPEEIKAVYETGQGSLRLRGTHEIGEGTKNSDLLVLTSIPYGVNKSTLVERIAEVVTQRKMPLLTDVRDVSADDVRIELELKKGADPQKVLAYLYKNTPLQTNVAVNMTCLVPTENPEVGRPERLDLHAILWHFLHFRWEVVTKRLEHELGALNRRIHILEGFEKIFDVLDQVIKLIRESDGKADAAQKLIKKFSLDAEQADAILELKLYRLAKLEILVVQKELAEKRARVRQIQRLLGEKSGLGRWEIVRKELEESLSAVRAAGKGRRTLIAASTDEPELTAEDLIIEEDAHVLLTADGWIKRQREIKDPKASRIREGDRVLACFAGSTHATAIFFSNLGTAYTLRIADVPSTTGYGDPIQKLFKLKDGEKIISAYSLDPRLVGDLTQEKPKHLALALSSDGLAVTFALAPFLEPSTKAGRRYAKLTDGQEIVSAAIGGEKQTVIAVSTGRRAVLCKLADINFVSGPSKGVTLMKLEGDERALGAVIAPGKNQGIVVKTSLGGEYEVTEQNLGLTGRAVRGHEVVKRGKLVEIVPPELSAPPPLEA